MTALRSLRSTIPDRVKGPVTAITFRRNSADSVPIPSFNNDRHLISIKWWGRDFATVLSSPVLGFGRYGASFARLLFLHDCGFDSSRGCDDRLVQHLNIGKRASLSAPGS